jgi:hypothetical protein
MNVTSPPPASDDAEQLVLVTPLQRCLLEVGRTPPRLADVAEMIAMISAYAEFERAALSKGELPNERETVELCLTAVLQFLRKQPWFMERGDIAPLLRLHAALCDLSIGKTSDLLKPAKKFKSGSPGDGITRKFIKAIAARALSEFIKAGEDINHSASRIARALKSGRRDMGHVKAETVVNWRERFEQGEGAGAQEDAIEQYRMPAPGDTPKERGENLLKALDQRGGAIG